MREERRRRSRAACRVVFVEERKKRQPCGIGFDEKGKKKRISNEGSGFECKTYGGD